MVLLAAGLPPGYPVNDAGAYHRMVEAWWQNGRPTYIGWNEMTLLGHLAPAVLLRAVGGGSVAARQLLVGFGALVLTALLCGLLVRTGARPGEAVAAAVAWLAIPLTLLSATCFMTEAPQALWCVAWLAAFTAWCRRGGAPAAVGWVSFAVAAFSVRQTGVVLPLAAAAAVFVVARERRGSTLALAAAALAADAGLWFYRGTLPLASVRPLTELMVALDPEALAGAAIRTGAEALATVGLLLTPVAAAAVGARGRDAVTAGGAVVGVAVALVLLVAGSSFPFWPNTLTVVGLLPDTLPPHGALAPVLPGWAWGLMTLLGVGSLAVLASQVIDRERLREPAVAASLAAVLGLVAVTAVSRAPFDRYLVPVVPLAVVAVAAAPRGGRRRLWPLAVLTAALAFSAVSVRGLHERQRAVWGVAEAQVSAGVPAEAVDGGFEWNLWHQPVPFAPEERRDPNAVLTWYESYPFTRLEPVRRLWIGEVPEGWREVSRVEIPGGHDLKVLERAGGLEPVWREVHDHIVATWGRAVVAEAEAEQPPLPVLAGGDLVFYWDTYFTNVGLLERPELVRLARANVDFLLGQVEAHGFVPNANQPWGLNRSQPPYLAVMVRELWEAGGAGDRRWLERAYRALEREHRFWTTDEVETHSTSVEGLQRYSHHASEEEREYFYDHVLVPRLSFPLDHDRRRKAAVAGPLLAEAGSGMDFTPRFEGRCDEFVAVDLNVNLVLYEQTLAWMADTLGLEGEPEWYDLAVTRWRRVESTCWNPQRGMFMDFDFVNRRHGRVASVMAYHPLWAGLATPEQAARTVASLPLFEGVGGVAACEGQDRPSGRQWGEGAVWAPLQYLVVAGLDRYGYRAEAARVASRYLDTVARNWVRPGPAEVVAGGERRVRASGALYEKYTVDGRVNDTEYPAGEGLGWTAGVFLAAFDYVTASPTAE